MHYFNKIFLSIVFILSATINSRAGGGWTYEKGKGFVKVSSYYIYAQQFLNGDGELVPITTTQFLSNSLYAEYGLTNKLTAIVNAPFLVRTTINGRQFPDGTVESTGDSYTGIGDLDLLLKYGVGGFKNHVFAVALQLGLPTGAATAGETGILQTGDGEFNQTLFGYASSGWNKNMYSTLYLGYNNRTNGFTDDIRYGAELGKTFEKANLALKLDGVKPVSNELSTSEPGNGLFNNRIEYLAFTLEYARSVYKSVGLSASMAGVFYGKRVLGAPAFSFGVYTTL